MRISIIALALAIGALPATAADMFMPAPMAPEFAPAPAANWTGFYVSVFGGAAFNPDEPGILEFDQELDGTFGAPTGTLGTAFGPNFSGARDGGFTGGIGVGYDLQYDQFVVGGIIDIAAVDYADRQEGFSATPASYSELREIDWLATARLRAGILVTDSLLAYVHGGLAAADVNYSFNTVGNDNNVSRGGDDMGFGYTVGAGLEAAVTSNIALGVEYAYTNLGDSDFVTNFDNGPFATVNGSTDVRGTDEDFDFHTVQANVKFRF